MAGENQNSGYLELAERIHQLLEMVKAERQALKEERDVMRQAVQTILEHLDSMTQHWEMSHRTMAASSRLEGELRESIREAHAMIDKLPGKRRQ